MKKHLILALGTTALALTLSCAPARAEDYRSTSTTSTTNTTPLSGVYVGGFGGYDWTNLDGGFDLGGTEWGILAGYEMGTVLNNGWGITGALEAHYAWSNADDSHVVGIVPTTIEKDNEWGISFRPGLAFMSDMTPLGLKPYGILGYRRAEFETRTAAGTTDSDHNGFELGIGTEIMAMGNIGVRLDYSHVFYGSDNGVDPADDDLRLGVTYHF